MRISDWSSDVCSSDLIILAEHEQHHVGVLLDRPRFTKVGKLRSLVLAAFDLAAELRQGHDRDIKFFCQSLEPTRNFGNLLHAIVAAARAALQELEKIGRAHV